jgi:hypothetical protein
MRRELGARIAASARPEHSCPKLRQVRQPSLVMPSVSTGAWHAWHDSRRCVFPTPNIGSQLVSGTDREASWRLVAQTGVWSKVHAHTRPYKPHFLDRWPSGSCLEAGLNLVRDGMRSFRSGDLHVVLCTSEFDEFELPR